MIIIPQTKGGVGKSTVAMQVIAPYLYKKHGKKITYIGHLYIKVPNATCDLKVA